MLHLYGIIAYTLITTTTTKKATKIHLVFIIMLLCNSLTTLTFFDKISETNKHKT